MADAAHDIHRREPDHVERGETPAREPVPFRARKEPAARPEEPKTEPSPAKTEAPPRKKRLRRVLFALAPLVVIGGALLSYLHGGRWAGTDDSYLRADIVNVTTDVPGIVVEVAVRDNQPVRKGDLLFRIDDEPYRIALEAAVAQRGVVANQLRSLQASYKQAQAQIAQARADVELTRKVLQRQTDLAAKNISTQAAFDQANRDFAAAQGRLNAAQQQADMTRAQLGGVVDGPIEQLPQFRQAQAQVDKAQRDLNHTRVTASDDGIVTNVPALQPGNYLNAAQVGFNLVATGHIWVEAFMKETDLTAVKPGDPATITVDTYPGHEFRAVVDSIAPASGAQFAVLPAQNSSGNWVKVVQRISVRLRLVADKDSPPLRAGMSVVTSIDTGRQRSLATLPHDLKLMVGL